MLIELYQPITGSSILICNAGTIVPLDDVAFEKAWERIKVYNQLVWNVRNHCHDELQIKVEGTIIPAYITDAEGFRSWYEQNFTEIKG